MLPRRHHRVHAWEDRMCARACVRACMRRRLRARVTSILLKQVPLSRANICEDSAESEVVVSSITDSMRMVQHALVLCVRGGT